MAADDGHAGRRACLVLEPRAEAFRRAVGPALFVELHRALRAAEAQPRARVDGDAQPVEAFEVVAPRARLVAVERGQERVGASPASIASTSRESMSAVAGVHCGSSPACTSSRSSSTHDERAVLQPIDQLVAIGRGEDRRERVLPMRPRVPAATVSRWKS